MTVHPPVRFALATGCVAGSVLLILSNPTRFGPANQTPDIGGETRGTLLCPRDGADDLDHQLAAVTARSRAKDDLIRDLIDGKTTLREVADKFLAMNAACPGYMSSLRGRFEGMADGELMARVVLESVELLADVPADRKRESLARLGDEFSRAFGSRPYPEEHTDTRRQVAVGPRTVTRRTAWRQPGPESVLRVRRWARAVGQGAANHLGHDDARPQ